MHICIALVLCLIPFHADARQAKENARIEHLISEVEAMKAAVFIRNGVEYDTKTAAAHLRMKLEKAGDRIKTAEDFIEGLASKSSLSGKPYKIRKADGTVLNTKTFLQSKLKEFDKPNS